MTPREEVFSFFQGISGGAAMVEWVLGFGERQRAVERERCAKLIERSKVGQGLWRIHMAAAIRQGTG